MKQEFVRLKSSDGIEMPGLLSSPEAGSDTLVLHVHGLNGNFYENKFVDTLARAFAEKNYAFLTFNNRGRDFVTELIRGDDYVMIGGSQERFVDCLKDIDGAIAWAKERGYRKIILEGHSYGCNKVVYYYAQRKDVAIARIVLLAPCDIPEEPKMFMTPEDYAKTKMEAEHMVAAGEETALIDYSLMANGKVAAGTFYYDFLPGGDSDIFRYVDGVEGDSSALRAIDLPVLVIFGDADKCMQTQQIDIVKSYLAKNLSDCKIEVILGASHSFRQRLEELGEAIKNNI